jgi:hypothetical protein
MVSVRHCSVRKSTEQRSNAGFWYGKKQDEIASVGPEERQAIV